MIPIMNYIGTVYKMAPADPIKNYQGESFMSHSWTNMIMELVKPLYTKDETRAEKLDAAV